jgi:hypothetical protein
MCVSFALMADLSGLVLGLQEIRHKVILCYGPRRKDIFKLSMIDLRLVVLLATAPSTIGSLKRVVVATDRFVYTFPLPGNSLTWKRTRTEMYLDDQIHDKHPYSRAIRKSHN